ncbi:MAG: hypothetical protein J6I40_07380 [Mailhella sp.]|nr:hypothetical protein [Mailhella sp.]
MSSNIRRRDFLRGLFRPLSQTSAGAWQPDERQERETDYLSMLPPEFSAFMLRQEAERLGGYEEGMSENDMAALVFSAMYGKGFQPSPRQ